MTVGLAALTVCRMFPDPAVSASLYSAGAIDDAFARVVAPLVRDLSAGPLAEARGYLWCMRYARGGAHLKLRVHGPAEIGESVRERLESLAASFLAGLPEAEPDAPRRSTAAPPLDVEDEGEHPDRTLLWTTYRRSPVVFGGGPLADDDRYAALFTRAAARGTERVAALFEEPEEAPSHGARQRLLFGVVAEGLAALGLAGDERTAYLKFHRDWLVRFPLLRQDDRRGKARRTLTVFEERAGGMARVREALGRHIEAAREAEPSDWGRALGELGAYVSGFADDPAYDHDPFTQGPLFPAVFKVFHNLANQVGLTMPHEAFAYHLLLAATAEPGFDRLDLPLP